MIRYADDKVVVCDTQKRLQELMDNLNRRIRYEDQCKKDKSDVYFKQRKDQSEHIYIDGQQTEQVWDFQYLGSLIADDGYCDKEIASPLPRHHPLKKYKN